MQKDGGTIHLNTRVEKIEQADSQFTLTLGDGQTAQFDQILSTTSPRLLRKLTPQLTGAYADQVDGLRNTGAVVVVAAIKEQMLTDGTYWLNLPATSPDKSQNEFPYVAFVEHTNYLPRENYGGDHLVYCGDYVPVDHEYFQMSEDELAQHFLSTLPKFNSNFQADWVKKYWVFRAPYAQPLPTVNHSENIPAIQTPIDGLYWASMSQVYPWDRGTNYAVEIGRRAARLMLEKLS